MPDELTADVIAEGLRLQDDRAFHGRDAWEAFAAHASEHYAAALRMVQAQAAELGRLRAILDAPVTALFADGREPTDNERHLLNLLSWREKEAKEAKAALARHREGGGK